MVVFDVGFWLGFCLGYYEFEMKVLVVGGEFVNILEIIVVRGCFLF